MVIDMNNKLIRQLIVLFIGGIGLWSLFGMQTNPSQAAPANPTATPTARLRAPRALTPTQTGVPTTNNPTINTANAAGRIISNPSFETHGQIDNNDNCESTMGGWFTSHPIMTSCRVFEVWSKNRPVDSLGSAGAPDGNALIELNAYSSSMAYQPICIAGGESFDFQFHHHTRSWNSTEETEFRFGIPSGLAAGSRAADTYSRQVIRGRTVSGASGSTSTASVTSYSGTTNGLATVLGSPTTNWVRYTGKHTVASNFGGIRNLGFFGISPTGGVGNMLDAITIGLVPFVDMGTSRDRIAIEGSSPTSLNIRINGRVTANTKIALRRNPLNPGPATSDSDFTIGTISAGIFGNTTYTHTSGSNVWLISVPAGDYDGGVVPANNQGGLTIPLNFIYDQVSETTEWAYFELAPPTKEGSSPYFDSSYTVTGGNWELVDPTCDNSFKNGVVYSMTDLGPTPTPSNTPTKTYTPSRTFTQTPTNTATTTPTRTATNTPTHTYTPTATNTPTHTYTPTYTNTNTPTNTATKTYTKTNTPTYTPTNTYTPTITNTPTNTLTDTPTETDTPTSTYTNTLTPTYTPTATNTRTNTPTAGPFAQIKTAIGDMFVLSLMQNGTLATWGQNEPLIRQSTIPPQYANMLFVDAAASIGNAYLLDENGNLYTWGENLYGEGIIPSDAQTDIRAIGAGARFALALRTDGTVAAWGRNSHGQVNVPAELTDVVAVDGGDRHAVALRGDGTVVAWGDNIAGQTIVPPGLTNVIAISAGENHTLALLRSGRVIGWGGNRFGQIKIPSTVTDIVKIAAGRECSLAVKADGTLITWGNPRYTKFPAVVYANAVVSVDSAHANSVVGLRDGRVYVAGDNNPRWNIFVSRTVTATPMISSTPSSTRERTATFTPLNTRTDTATPTATFTPTVSRTGTNTRTLTPSRTKRPSSTRTFTPTP